MKFLELLPRSPADERRSRELFAELKEREKKRLYDAEYRRLYVEYVELNVARFPKEERDWYREKEMRTCDYNMAGESGRNRLLRSDWKKTRGGRAFRPRRRTISAWLPWPSASESQPRGVAPCRAAAIS
jgi:hypothetical protein